MFKFKILSIEPERMNIMIYRILDFEKKILKQNRQTGKELSIKLKVL